MKISKMTLSKLPGDAWKCGPRTVRKLPDARDSEGLRGAHRFHPNPGDSWATWLTTAVVCAIYSQPNCLLNDLPRFPLTILPGKLFHTFMTLCVGKKIKKATLPDICSEFVFLSFSFIPSCSIICVGLKIGNHVDIFQTI